MKKKFLTTELLRDIIPVNNSRRRMSLKMEDTVKNRTCPKRPFAWYVEKPSAKDYLLTVFIFAVCTLIGLLFQKLDYRYEYCNDIHSGCVDHFHRDRWLSLQCSWLLFKCILILFFPDGAKDVF